MTTRLKAEARRLLDAARRDGRKPPTPDDVLARFEPAEFTPRGTGETPSRETWERLISSDPALARADANLRKLLDPLDRLPDRPVGADDGTFFRWVLARQPKFAAAYRRWAREVDRVLQSWGCRPLPPRALDIRTCRCMQENGQDGPGSH